MSLYAISEVSDKEKIRAFLLKDEDYGAYALGDLEDPYARHARWTCASRTGTIAGLALVYDALEPTTLFLMGDREAISALLVYGVGPDSVLFIAPPETEDDIQSIYDVEHMALMHRMRLPEGAFRAYADDSLLSPIPLDESHTQDMLTLILQAAKHDSRDLRDVAFEADMVPGGMYFGIYEDGMLVAMAGTHLIAPGARLAAVGNVVVHPSRRRRGLAKLVSSAVTKSLLDEGLDFVVLNVQADNTPAIRVYESLGYEIRTLFIEGVASRVAR